MEEKNTGDLRRELMEQDSIDTYIKDNAAAFMDKTVAELLAALYDQKSLSKAELARRASMSEVYLHQVFSGRRNPSRDRLLCLCIGLGATLEETQTLLKQASYAQLYPKSKRDAIVIHGLLHGTELNEINDKLFSENEKTLF